MNAVEIVILAMIAAFLGLRLYSVLGRRAEHEEEPIPRRFDEKQDAPPQIAPRAAVTDRPAASKPLVPGVAPAIERGLREISAADRRFDVIAFIDGSKSAYRMILEAFWRGDKDELGQLCDGDVYAEFATAIDARAAAGETMDNRLVRIEEATLVAASLDGQVARIAMRFTADVAAITRNADGVVVAGTLDDAIETHDLWTFSRNVTSADPDWLLDETDEG